VFANALYAVQIVDPKTGEEKNVVISVDDGIRLGTTASGLAKLKPVFKKDGTTTAGIAEFNCFLLTQLECFHSLTEMKRSTCAGNSSQVSDGAGAVLLMKRSVAMKKGLPIFGVFRCLISAFPCVHDIFIISHRVERDCLRHILPSFCCCIQLLPHILF
jgi:acetyl-CoA acetyltransferase